MTNVVKGRFGAATPTREEAARAESERVEAARRTEESGAAKARVPGATQAAAASPDGNRGAVAATVYGLDNCSTCNKARLWLARAEVPHAFVDYRKHPIDGAALKAWAKVLGWEKLVNRASLTWRGLPPERKDPQGDAEWLLLVRDHPSLIRRPLVARPGVDANGAPLVSVGFTDKLFQSLFASDPST